MPGATFLRSDRLTFCTVENDDADIELLQRVHNDPEFRERLLFRYPQSREEIESLVESTEAEDDRLDPLVCVNEEPVGSTSLFDIRQGDHATLAYWLLPEHRGASYGTEAAALLIDHVFRTLGLHRVLAWTIGYNEASQALLRRLSFTHEGTFREHVFRAGSTTTPNTTVCWPRSGTVSKPSSTFGRRLLVVASEAVGGIGAFRRRNLLPTILPTDSLVPT